MLNNCIAVESPSGQTGSIDCNTLCDQQQKICIKQYYGYYDDHWSFDPGGNCNQGYASTNNANEEGGSKLNCMCC